MKRLILQERLNQCFAEFHNNIAIHQGIRKVTYTELDRRSDCVARFLMRKGIKKETFIGVLTGDRIELISSIIGILKANCVFAPLDPAYPEKRLNMMMDSGGISFILCDRPNYREYATNEKKQGLEFFIIEDIFSRDIPHENEYENEYDSEDKVYLYFTSGTTGKPKAVVGRNKGLLHFINWEIEAFNIDETFRFSQLTTPGFDVFLRDIFVPLCAGATICIPESKEVYLEPRHLAQWLATNRINLIHCVPTLFRLFSTFNPAHETFAALKYILLAGERTNPADLQKWFETHGEKVRGVQLVNLYGPTETTLAKVFYLIREADAAKEIIPIGKPIPGARVIILDDNMELCAELEVGELYIRTPYRTFGYYNDPELNRLKFIPNPFSDNPDDIIYRTGDLGRFLPDGNIELLGRLDRQVKIRGMRIELEELESTLAGHPDVKEAAVIKEIQSLDNVSLAALITVKTGVEKEEKSLSDNIKKYLYERLPDYMVPAVIKKIDTMPRKPNLKIDFEALAGLYQQVQEKNYLPPGNKIEKKLVETWSTLLGIAKNKISVMDSFFELGGNSLNIMTLISGIQQEWNVRLPLGAVFNNPSIKQLAVLVAETGSEEYKPIAAVELQEYDALSSAQKRLYVIQQMDPESTNYNMPALAVLTGRLEKDRFEQVLQQLLARHDSLRTSFEMIGDLPVQRVHPKVDFAVDYYSGGEDELEKITADFIRPFDLSKAPLVRVGLLNPASEKHILMFDWHHMITDGVSLGILTREFMLLYAGEAIAPVKISYRDYAAWQYGQKATAAFKEQETFWVQEFAGDLPVIDLPVDFKRPAVQSFAGAAIDFEINRELTGRLNALALAENVTPYMVLLGLFNIFLAKLTGMENIICGTPIAGRSHPDLEQVIGMFVNTLVLNNWVHGQETFTDFLAEVKVKTLRAFENQDYQYEDLVEKVDRARDISRNPLFDVMFVFQDIEIALVKIGDLKFMPYRCPKITAKFDLLLTVEQRPDDLVCTFEYGTALFKKETIARFAGFFQEIVTSILNNSGLKIAEIEIMSAAEKTQLLFDFNNTETDYPRDKTIHQLFAEQACRTPDRIAVIGVSLRPVRPVLPVGLVGQVSLTYRQLNEQSAQLANVLVERGVLADTIVGIMLGRSIEMIIAILAILKAGGAYLPIDPEYPQERIDYMLKDSSAAILINKSEIRNSKFETNPNVQNSNDQNKNKNRNFEIPCVLDFENLNFEFVSNFDIRISDFNSSNLAYVIYTSGSTGKPKGVMVEHRSVVNRLNWMQRFYPLGLKDVILQKTPVVFDVSVWELFWWFFGGASLRLLGAGEEKQPAAVITAVVESNVTTMHFVPSMLNAFLEYLESTTEVPVEKLNCLQRVFSSGEALGREQVERFHRLLKRTGLINLYGPTEATVDVSYFNCTPAAVAENSVLPIGKPIDNIQLYILDKYLAPVPVGSPGELHISGDGLARGYLNRPELTCEKFKIKNISGEAHHSILYCTGDLARWLPTGNIEFLGRIDSQVKIRGNRIELGEIENRLITHPGIKDAAAAVKKDKHGDSYLCAYLVSDKKLILSELRHFLFGSLPAYMIPSYFVPLTMIPLTASGKVDRKRLPEPEGMNLGSGSVYIAPRNTVEKELARVWQELLDKNLIGMDDNFFELGGDSIKAIQVVSRMRKAGYKVEMKDILRVPRISNLALVVEKIKREEPTAISGPKLQDNRGGKALTPSDLTYPGLSREALDGLQKRFSFAIEDIYTLSPMQEGMFFHASYGDKNNPAYFEQISYRLRGTFSVPLVEKSLNVLFKRHEILRAIFVNEGLDRPVQVVLKDRAVDFYYGDLRDRVTSAEDKERLVSEFKEQDRRRSFDLAGDVLMRVAVLQSEDEEYWVAWSFHHILMDGWCTGILIAEFFKIYNGLLENREYPLPAARPYRLYIQWLGNLDKSKSAEYWSNYLEDYSQAVGIPRLPIDGTSRAGYQKGQMSFTLDRETVQQLKRLAGAGNITLNTVIRALWGILLGQYNDKRDVVFGAVVSGRPGEIEGVESMVGLFINTVPVRIRFEEDTTFNRLLIGVQQDALDGDPHQYSSLADIQAAHPLKQNLLDHIMVFENYPIAKQVAGVTTLELSDIEIFEQSNYDFNVIVGPGEDLHIAFAYNAHVYETSFVEKIAAQFKYTVEQAVANWDGKMVDFTLLSDADRRLLLIEFNRTEAEYPADKTIHQLFAEQAEKTPDHIALVGADLRVCPNCFSYRQLNDLSGRLAGLLIAKGVLVDSIVGIMMERSLEMIIGLLAILKSGGVYLPIDPEYPRERIDYMLKDSGARILINKSEIRNPKFETNPNETNPNDQNKNFGIPFVLNFENLNLSSLKGCPRRGLSNFDIRISNFNSLNLAYIIYTSGSTGRPKGVMIEHRNVVRLVRNVNYIELRQGDRLLLTGKFIFDITTFEIWGSLLNGLSLYLAGQDTVLDSEKLKAFLSRNRIDILHLIPQVFNQLASSPGGPGIFVGLRYLLVGGDLVRPGYINIVRNKYPGLKILHMYGPTENTTFSTFYPVATDFELAIPIGKPISNSCVYVAGKNNNLLPIGGAGELLVGGAGVARGYLNNPELTNKSFAGVQGELFQKRPLVSHTYHTGDLARWLPGGNLQFLGRIDQQVKIRGFRIELEEIEQRLLQHPGVKDAVVTVLGDREEDKYLCAYLVGVSEPSELRSYLSRSLPGYMIPTYFIELEKMPLNPNGKIDRGALPKPGIKAGSAYVAPGNEIEEQLAQIWAEVLAVSTPIGVHDNFFELGGHSLKATTLAAKIHEKLNIKLPLSEIFALPTIRGLAGYIVNVAQDGFKAIEVSEEREYYALSPAQERLYFLQQMEPGATAYNMPQFFIFESDLDIEKLTGAFHKLIRRHDSLRTSFHIIDDQPVQRVHEKVEFEIENFATDLHGQTRTFDLSCAPLLRVGIGEIQGERRLFMVDLHHIIADGLSLQVLIRDFSAFYAGQYLAPLRLQYKDFSQWQKDRAQQEKIKQQESYWLEEFAEEAPALDLPTDRTRPAMQSYEGKSIDFLLAEKETQQLKSLALKEDVTLFMVLLAAFNVLAAKLSGREDIVTGVPSAGRRHADLQHIMGMFVNTLPIRNYPNGQKNFTGFLREVKTKTLQAFENQDFQFEALVEKLDLARDPSRNPLFDIMLVVNNFADAPREIPGGLRLTPYRYDTGTAKFDLVLTVVERDGILFMDFQYGTQLFDPATIERFIGYFKAVVASVIEEPGRIMAGINILSEEEKKRLLVDFNGTAIEYPTGKTLHQLFEEQSSKTPDRIALSFRPVQLVQPVRPVSLTYRRLNEQSNGLAGVLIEKGVTSGHTSGHIVAVMMEPSIEMVIGVLGILKTGGAYLPIDPGYPEERVNYLLKDSGARIFINKSEIRNPKLETNPNDQKINDQNKNRHFEADLVLNFENLDFEFVSDFEFRASNFNSSNLAYIIYTSGSTGAPKGVMVEHRSVVNYITWAQRFYFQGGGCDFALYSSLSFDLTVTSLYAPLLSGGKVVVYPGDDSEFVIAKILRDDCVQAIKLTPTHLKMVMEVFRGEVRNIKKLIVGGEDLAVELAREVQRLFKGNIEIYNEYGPTEATVGCMNHRFDPVVDSRQSVPIGVPIANAGIYILDSYRLPVAVGVAGELYVAGDGLARGYLNNVELTNQKFLEVQEPFFKKVLGLFYKTGDLARWLVGGKIEFLGRSDQQVKIRGFRIEPGEIEKHLSGHGEIKEAIVTVVENVEGKTGRYLCAYIVPKTSQSLNILELRDYLNGLLPAYMVPAYFVSLPGFPLTPSGKIDRKALPLPQPGIQTGENYEAPQNEIQAVLVENWQAILGVERISINDNFFQAGGDSIDAIRLASRLVRYNLKLQVRDLFLYPTIGQLSRYIKKVYHEIPQRPVEGEVELTPIQEWFFREHLIHPHHYNQAAMLFRPEGFREEDINKIFTKIVAHHDALRMVYGCRVEGGRVKQWNRGLSGCLFDLEVIDSKEIEAEAGRIQAGIDLENGPLVKLGLFKTREGDYLLIAIHHLVIDGVSWRILLEDFTNLFNRLARGEEMVLPLKTTSFKTWAEEMHRYGDSRELAAELAYWQKLEQEECPPLPKDRIVRERKRKDSGKISFRLTEGDTERLLKEVHKAYNTEINDILLTALGLALNDWVLSGRGVCGGRFLIWLEGHGREDIFEGIDISRTVGWFTSLFPVCLDMKNADDIAQAIKNTKEMLRNIPHKGIGYGVFKYLSKQGFLMQSEQLKPGICFNYLGQFDGDLDTGIFRLAEIAGGHAISPDSENPYALDISGAIAGGKLSISLDYNRLEYDEKSIAGMAERFEMRLKQIIAHCTGKKETELTVSDLSSPGINQGEVDSIFAELEDALSGDDYV